jgi:hypothetical protein
MLRGFLPRIRKNIKTVLHRWQLLLLILAGWINRRLSGLL